MLLASPDLQDIENRKPPVLSALVARQPHDADLAHWLNRQFSEFEVRRTVSSVPTADTTRRLPVSDTPTLLLSLRGVCRRTPCR